ncbi:MAG: GDP-mannose 4,6-dehydratase [Thermoproteota archaeon]
MKCLVTGCAGFIGSHLSQSLLSEGHKVFGIDNFHNYYDKSAKLENIRDFKRDPNFSLIEESILSERLFEHIPKDVDIVFHLAAIAGVRYSIDHPSEYFTTNVIGTQKLLEFYKQSKFVYASSSSVYGSVPKEQLPVSESAIPHPISPYALSKLQGEQICLLYSELYGTEVCIVRYFTVYGPRQRPDEVFTKFIRLAFENKPLTVYGDGSKTRDFTHVQDIVDGTMKAAKVGDGIYNLGSGSNTSVNSMISMMQEVLGRKLKVNHIASPPGDVPDTYADITKAKKELKYTPRVGLKEGIKSCLEWYKTSVYF